MKFFFSILFSVFLYTAHASEFFLQAEKAGYYSVSISDQTLIASSGFFRFFDLASGNHNITVTELYSGSVVYTGTIQLAVNTRKVARLDSQYKFFEIANVPATWSNWYTPAGTNNEVVKTEPKSNPPIDFEAAIKEIDREAFDDRKLEKAKSITSKTTLTTGQISRICKLFDFDDNRLKYAKYAYDFCSDKVNYFKVSSTMTFSSNGSELDKYIESRK